MAHTSLSSLLASASSLLLKTTFHELIGWLISSQLALNDVGVMLSIRTIGLVRCSEKKLQDVNAAKIDAEVDAL